MEAKRKHMGVFCGAYWWMDKFRLCQYAVAVWLGPCLCYMCWDLSPRLPKGSKASRLICALGCFGNYRILPIQTVLVECGFCAKPLWQVTAMGIPWQMSPIQHTRWSEHAQLRMRH